MKKALIGSMMMLSAVFGANAAEAVTVEEYNTAPGNIKDRAITLIVSDTYHNLAAKSASPEKLECIRNFYSRQEITTSNGGTYTTVPGLEAIFDQIHIANENGDTHLRIEDLVLGTMNAECS